MIEHWICLKHRTSIHTKPHKFPLAYREQPLKDILDMEKEGMIKHSTSQLVVVLVIMPKNGGTPTI